MARNNSLRKLLTERGFSNEQASEILARGNWLEVLPGTRLVVQNAAVPYLAFVESGEVGIFAKHSASINRFRVASLGEGDLVGWELLAGKGYGTFEIQARRHTRLFTLSLAQLASLTESNVGTAIQLVNVVQTMRAIEQTVRPLCTSRTVGSA